MYNDQRMRKGATYAHSCYLVYIWNVYMLQGVGVCGERPVHVQRLYFAHSCYLVNIWCTYDPDGGDMRIATTVCAEAL